MFYSHILVDFQVVSLSEFFQTNFCIYLPLPKCLQNVIKTISAVLNVEMFNFPRACHEVNTPPSSAEVKKELSYTSTHPMGPPGPVKGFPLPLPSCHEVMWQY